METLKKIGTGIVSALLWCVILLAALFAFTTLASRDASRVANLAGYTPLTVQSDSMLPTFAAGDLIIIRQCDPSTLREGDIITFHAIIQNEYVLNTHRIEQIRDTGARSYVTKGDNNHMSDSHVIADGDIVGKYVGKIPYMGRVLDFLSGSVGFLLVIVLPMLLFFVYQVYHLIMVSINLKKAVAIENAMAAQEAVEQTQSDAQLEAQRLKEEAEAALAEAKRLKEEAEAALAAAKSEQTGQNAPETESAENLESEEPAEPEEPAPAAEVVESEEPAQVEETSETPEPAEPNTELKAEEENHE